MAKHRFFVALLALTAAAAWAAVPRIASVEPDAAKPGEEVAAKGSDLGAANVVGFYLTDGTNDHEVEVLEQTPEVIRFTVPEIEPGYYRLMILTGGPQAAYLEQPVSCRVKSLDEPDEDKGEVSELVVIDDPLAKKQQEAEEKKAK